MSTENAETIESICLRDSPPTSTNLEGTAKSQPASSACSHVPPKLPDFCFDARHFDQHSPPVCHAVTVSASSVESLSDSAVPLIQSRCTSDQEICTTFPFNSSASSTKRLSLHLIRQGCSISNSDKATPASIETRHRTLPLF